MQEQRSACPGPSRSSRQRSPRRDRKPAKGFRPFKFGRDHGFILNDGVWEKPHDPAFIANVSVEETKAALAAVGIPNEVAPIPFNITLLKFGNEPVLFDAGTGGQFQPTAGAMIANMAAAGIEPAQIIYAPSNEFKFWMDSSIFTRPPEKQHGLPKRLQAMFPLLKDKVKQYEWDTEVIPGIHSIAASGHTAGHTAFVTVHGFRFDVCDLGRRVHGLSRRRA